MDLFPLIEQAISTPTITEKWKLFQQIEANLDRLNPNSDWPVREWERPSYLHFCRAVPPSQLPKRGWGSRQKRGALLHSILHIEASAIDLALDAAYRFRGLPLQFYRDWLQTAKEEFKHYFLIEELLKELGYKYGDFPVHTGLFETARQTPDLLSRMAIVPRWFEAHGLDVNRRLIEKLKKYLPDPFTEKTIGVLEIILEEEIPHVQRGDYWFKWECRRRGLNPLETYFQLVEKFVKNWKGGDLNLEARLKAGFSCEELEILSGKKVC